MALPVATDRARGDRGRGGRESADAPGLAKARARRSELASDLADTTRSTHFPELFVAELLGDDDVLEEDVVEDVAAVDPLFSAAPFSAASFSRAAFSADRFSAAGFGEPRLGGAKVPLASLERPSSALLELTPSPVPRVQLAPATGAVDISLVPGPNVGYSRNLPTLAAQHVLGRRQQRRPAAPALTVPPTGTTAREPRSSADLTKNVRSSKREVVLGLVIGLGLSMLLAAAGQSYLHEDVIAEGIGVPAEGAAGEIESVTLSARPESPTTTLTAPAPGAAAAAPPPAAQPSAAEPLDVSRGAAGAPYPGRAPSSAGSTRAPRPAHEPAPNAAAGVDESPLLARARPEPRRAGERAQRSGRERKGARGTPAITTEPPVFEVDKALSEPAHERTPLSPAESAGLGLDLPL